MGCGQSMISQVETGRCPPPEDWITRVERACRQAKQDRAQPGTVAFSVPPGEEPIANSAELRAVLMRGMVERGWDYHRLTSESQSQSHNTVRALLDPKFSKQFYGRQIDFHSAQLAAMAVAMELPFADLPLSERELELLDPEVLTGGRVFRVPVFSQAAAASAGADLVGVLSDGRSREHADGWIPWAGDIRGIFGVRVSGRSMEPAFLDGDVVVCKFGVPPERGKPAVICLDARGVLLKRWEVVPRRTNHIRLTSDNRRAVEAGESEDITCTRADILWANKVQHLRRDF